ncbi:hypothetical protein HNQ92_004351 [Rhabdobacter roseus]|uniref:Uncharacterized protein n=1 Tax=Rhabdobacter roseus TaxID=1655419 RepID=A0A840TQQ7_9BACT|nr:hypothetical protein [Rhabdobacter roseus]
MLDKTGLIGSFFGLTKFFFISITYLKRNKK